MAEFEKITKDGERVKLDGSPAKVPGGADVSAPDGPYAEVIAKYKVPADLVAKATTKKAVIEAMVVANLEGLHRDYIMEKYYQKMNVTKSLTGAGGSQVWRQQLGTIQQSIKAKESIIEYLTPLYVELN